MAELKLNVATPERVSVELPIAGIGYRALAYLVDLGVLLAAGLVIYFVYSLLGPSLLEVYQGVSGVVRSAALAGLFFALWIYWTLSEVLWHGQTLGKRLVGIRVVRSDGSPVTLYPSAIRNLLRLVDFLPWCYPVGVMVMLSDRQHRRLGDLMAGTVLVREQRIDLARYELASVRAGASSLSSHQVELVTSFLQRFEQFDAAPRLRVGRQLAEHLGLEPEKCAALDDTALKQFLTATLGGQ